jgi:flagellar basal-body rod modification protein FlgD
MSIASIASVLSPTAKTASSASLTGGVTMGKEDFLKLLVAQLQKQDPLNPQDPTQFTSQLAQFSSLEQLMGVNENLTSLADQQVFGSQMTATGLIGRTVQVQGSQITMASGTASSVRYNLPEASTQTTMNIYNQAGGLVDSVNLGANTTGNHDFTWDGQMTNGSRAADGIYRFEVAARNAAGTAITASTTFGGTVTGASFDQGQTMLQIG